MYEGYFLKNDFHGQGWYKWLDGREYKGCWDRNKMHGEGALTYGDGR